MAKIFKKLLKAVGKVVGGVAKALGLVQEPQVMQAPAPVEIKAPVVNLEQVDRSAADVMRRRRGTQATITGAGSLGTTAGSVAAKSLLGQ